MIKSITAMAATLIILCACSSTPDENSAADFVFVNGKVYTLDAATSWAEAVAVRGDNIVYVGDNEGAEAFVGDATGRIDLSGKLLLPGFIDSHIHPIDEAGLATALSLPSESGDIEGWVRAIADYADANPDKEVVYGYGFMASAFGANGPTRQLIDAVVPDRPVLIIDEGMHSAWANTAALERLNITRDTPDPVPGFSYYKRDANGEATGFLLEGTVYAAMVGLEVATAEVVAEGTAIVLDLLNQYGVTSVFDAGAFDLGAEDINGLLAGLAAQDELTVRIVGSMYVDRPELLATAVELVDAMRQSVRGDRYRYNTLKILGDGAIEGRTAAMFEDYSGDGIEPGNAGATVFTEAELVELISGAAARDIDVHIHALGERAVHEALNAIAAVRKTAPESDSRYTLAHIQVVTDQDVPRFAELDVTAQSTPLWATYDTYGKEFISDDQFQRYFRFKSIEDAGGRLAFGSDFPASGLGILGLSPLLQIELGHTRQYPGDPDSPLQPRASERLSVASLVRGFTLGAAYQLHMEDEIGSIEVGKKADLVVLDQDIFEIDPFTIHKTAVVMTMMDGNIVYSAEPGNVLLSEFTGPYGGVPRFDAMQVADLKPALEAGMARKLAEIDAIANNPAPPDFDNTIVAYERSGKDLERVYVYRGILSSNMSTPEFREVQQEMAPKLAEFDSKIIQNDALFQRIKSVYESDASNKLSPDQQRLIWLTYDRFASGGATLQGAAKDRYAAINQRLAELQTMFGNNVLADEEGYVTYISAEQLAGLSASFVAVAAAAATDRGRAGEYAITNTRSSIDPFLTFSEERELREEVWRTFYNRGDNGDANDNNAIIAEIVQLRHERAGLLGYDNYAAWQVQNRMAKTPERALALLEAVWPAAISRVREEVADMQEIADASGIGIAIEPWDYRFYMEKLRQQRYAISSDEVKQYLQLDKLREAMFFVAGELFNFNFSPVPAGSVPVWHADVLVWEVTDKTSGEHVGLWYLDPFARPGKRSGAWATSYRSHETHDGKRTPLVSNNSNFVKGEAGKATLISWDDAETFFHEFGHALHGLSSSVSYPTLNGGVRDYTEFQSQLLERWLMTDEVINNYLRHVDTGAPMPAALVQKIKNAATFKKGFDTAEYLASALVDLRYHMSDPEDLDPDAFERETLADLGMPSEIVMRHRSPHFGHIFSGESYSAGYYGYMWADVLTADAAEAFREAPGGFYDKVVARRLVDHLFAVRNAVDPAEAYRAFRGRDAEIDALMRDRGFQQ